LGLAPLLLLLAACWLPAGLLDDEKVLPAAMEDFEVSADGTLVAPGTMRSRRDGAEQGRKAARDAEKEKRKAEKSAARGKKNGSGIKCLPLVMLFVVVGPAVFPVLMQAMELVGNSAVGLAAYDSCIQVGLCSTYRDQLIA
jgi:hypothetical protein